MQVETVQEHESLIHNKFESLRVLVVDDEKMIRETIGLFLETMGISFVREADTGEKALHELAQNDYDFVFMDLMMPGIDGLETLNRINKTHQDTNVIIMTGYPSMDVVIEAMHSGASDFLVKPFRFQDIKIILERISRLRKLMEKNWFLKKELEGKKEVERLNNQLQRRIRIQSQMFNIIDSLSLINQSEELYTYLVKKATESSEAFKACFMILDQRDSNLLVLAQNGLDNLLPGTKANLINNPEGNMVLDNDFILQKFGESVKKNIMMDSITRVNGFFAIPFKIRNEPFGILIVTGKKKNKSFNSEDEFILKFLVEKAALNIENIALYDNIKQTLMASLMSLVSAIEAKDPYTQQHSTRVTEMAIGIATQMRIKSVDIQKISTSGPLHDIGKIGINDSILNKPGKLTESEFAQIKNHPLIGENIITPLGLDHDELSIIRNHHERWDGMGYPDGLIGEEIPKLTRIIAVADAFDAMSSDRAYRKALPFEVCLHELNKNKGTQFDPDVIDVAIPYLSSLR